MAATIQNLNRKCIGLFTRRERWGLSLRGWLVLVGLVLALAVTWIFRIQPFLAPTERVATKILIVEGWVHPFAIAAAVQEFQTGHYEKVFTTGGPVVGSGGYVNDFNTSASVGAELLVKAGIPPAAVQMAPSQVSGRDRTYSSARALREWFRAHNLAVPAVNVLTEDVHARRTRLLFQKALGREVRVGIIAVADPDYDAEHWWRNSEGVRQILAESIAYLYAAGWFRPEPV